MAVTATKTTERAEQASPAEVVASKPDAVEYPDRPWIAQSVRHGDAVGLAKAALQHHFRDRDDVLVAMELVVYYVRGDNRAWLRPDVQVVFGVGSERERSTFKVWDEGKAPDFVLEVASPSTAENDARHKAREYAAIGVREYWRLDPTGTLMGTPLEGYRSLGSRYGRVESLAGPGGIEYLRSGVLGLDLRTARRDGATVLVMRDPQTGEEFDGSVEEYDRRRRIAEDERDATKGQLEATQAQLEATRDRLSAAEAELSAVKEAAKAEVSAARDRTSGAEERVRVLERRLRALTDQSHPMGRDSKG